MKYFSIAIDGPSGAGKSTIAKLVANELGFTYIDTGAMYRAVTYKAMMLNIPLGDEDAYSFLDNLEISFSKDKVFIDGEDVTEPIRSIEVTKNVSLVSSLLAIRQKLVDMQRKMAEGTNVVMDGRDIGTNVLPNADLKIYLNASLEERAKRRYVDLLEKNAGASYEFIYNDLARRDDYDSHRKYNPLTKADDALEIDSSKMTIFEVLEKIIALYKEFYKNERNRC